MAMVPPFGELITAATSSAVHLEMRDAYTPEDQRFLDWQAGKLLPEQANPEGSAIGRSHTPRGGGFRPAPGGPEPLAPFLPVEYGGAAQGSSARVGWLAGGEEQSHGVGQAGAHRRGHRGLVPGMRRPA